MDKLPVIETERIRLRVPEAKDIPRIMEYADNQKISKTTLNIPHPYEEKDAIFWINMANQGLEDGTHFVFAICLLPDDKFIGGIGLHKNERFNRAELGFWIGEPFWNKGYVTEAAGQILKFGFEQLNLHKIFAIHLTDNPASGKVMIKNGMVKEGELVDHIRKDDKYLTVVQYRITKDEYSGKI